MTPKEALEQMGIEVKSDFVPYSKSRSTGGQHFNLNWLVTVWHNGKPVLTTDYSAGMAHCPSYKQNARATLEYMNRIEHECETGTTARMYHGMGHIGKGKAINPDAADVMYSLVMESSVLDYGSFEDWAGDFGYDSDSREAESIYRTCLDTALKMRAGIGDEKMRALQEAFEDY